MLLEIQADVKVLLMRKKKKAVGNGRHIEVTGL